MKSVFRIPNFYILFLFLLNFNKSFGAPCKRNEFKCKDKSCISKYWKCDSIIDCDDGSDERDCPTRLTTTNSKTSPICPININPFYCANLEKCLPYAYTCNGIYDCQDGSDEDTKLCTTKYRTTTSLMTTTTSLMTTTTSLTTTTTSLTTTTTSLTTTTTSLRTTTTSLRTTTTSLRTTTTTTKTTNITKSSITTTKTSLIINTNPSITPATFYKLNENGTLIQPISYTSNKKKNTIIVILFLVIICICVIFGILLKKRKLKIYGEKSIVNDIHMTNTNIEDNVVYLTPTPIADEMYEPIHNYETIQ